MRAEELIGIFSEQPFVPMRLHMSNGRVHEIRHPEMAIVGEEVVALGIVQDESELPRIRMVSISHINEIEHTPSKTG